MARSFENEFASTSLGDLLKEHFDKPDPLKPPIVSDKNEVLRDALKHAGVDIRWVGPIEDAFNQGCRLEMIKNSEDMTFKLKLCDSQGNKLMTIQGSTLRRPPNESILREFKRLAAGGRLRGGEYKIEIPGAHKYPEFVTDPDHIDFKGPSVLDIIKKSVPGINIEIVDVGFDIEEAPEVLKTFIREYFDRIGKSPMHVQALSNILKRYKEEMQSAESDNSLIDEMKRINLDRLDSFEGLVDSINAKDYHWGTPPIQSEDQMGFGKRSTVGSFPDNIKDLDFTKLTVSQRHVLENYLGIDRECSTIKGAEARREALKKFCFSNAANTARAQKGYETIVLGKTAVDETVETKAFAVVSSVINSHRNELSELAEKGLTSLMEKLRAAVHREAKDALREAADRVQPIVIKTGDKVRKVKGTLPPEFKKMVELASARVPIMLVGPAGCGKTYLCEKLAEALDMEFSDQSCSEGMSESVFNGLLLPIGKGGEFNHVTSPFMDRYEGGGVMLLDEIDAGDPNLFTYINKAIANRSYTVAQRYKNPSVKKHEDFVLVCAANTFGHGADAMYVGRNQLDAATLDRFKVGLIAMDYDHEVERSIADNEDLCQWAWKIRARIKEQKIRRIMSTRVIKDMATMTRMYKWKVDDWNSAYFAGWSDAEKRMVTQ